MEERIMRRVADSAVIQTQLVLNSHLNGAGRLFGGQLMEWIDVVATVRSPHRSMEKNTLHTIYFHLSIRCAASESCCTWKTQF